MDIEEQATRTVRPGAIAAGLIVLAVGIAMLVDVTAIADIRMGRLIPGFVLIAIGSAIVLDKGAIVVGRREFDAAGRRRVRLQHRGGSMGGVWLILVGAWMLVSQAHMFGLSYHTSWPLLVVFAGVMIVIRGLR